MRRYTFILRHTHALCCEVPEKQRGEKARLWEDFGEKIVTHTDERKEHVRLQKKQE